MGKSQAKAATRIQNQVSDNAFGISNTATTSLAPYAQTAGKFYNDIVKGDPASISRSVGPQIDMSRQLFSQAQQQIDRNTPKGGFRDQATADLATKQAGDISHLISGGVNDALQRLEGLGQFGTTAGLQGLGVSGNAGDSLARLSAAKAQAVGQGIAGIGSAAGFGLGAKAMKPKSPGVGGAIGVPNSQGAGDLFGTGAGKA